MFSRWEEIGIFLAPIWALLVGGIIQWLFFHPEVYELNENLVYVLAALMVEAHLVLVFLRSHLNSSVRIHYPYRFWLVPILVLGTTILSNNAFIILGVTGVFWDVWHSSLQTFGFSRMIDTRYGYSATEGRSWDKWICVYIYIAPIFMGEAFEKHLRNIEDFYDLSFWNFPKPELLVNDFTINISRGILSALGAALFFGYYRHMKKHRKNYSMPKEKLVLMSTTFAVSVFAWGMNSFGQSFLIMNFFHAFQYFAFVIPHELNSNSWKLKPGIIRKFVGISIVALCALYGFIVVVFRRDIPLVNQVAVCVSLMHFWYDGFVWSVRKGEIKAI